LAWQAASRVIIIALSAFKKSLFQKEMGYNIRPNKKETEKIDYKASEEKCKFQELDMVRSKRLIC
jgi:hypothetical protein